MLTLQSTDLSPFWLGLSYLLRKIQVTNRTVGAHSESSALQSGTSGMKHVSFKDDKNNYFVLKKTKKESDKRNQQPE